MQRTLCAVQSPLLNVDISDIARRSLQQLVTDGLVTRKQQQTDAAVTRLDVTRFGRAVYKGAAFSSDLVCDLSAEL